VEEIARCVAPRERLNELLRRPLGSGIGRDVEMEWASPLVCQDHKDIQHSKTDSRHNEEVSRNQLLHMVAKESTPRLRWRPLLARHVLRDRGLGYFDTKFEQFPMDTRCSPERVRQTYLSD
jgi:hypothetical protein